MKWNTIETAPKDGTEIVLWCDTAKSMLMRCRWESGEWREWNIGGFDNMGWQKLEPYEKPTHWMRVLPPCDLVMAAEHEREHGDFLC
jgi:hypothetical protein